MKGSARRQKILMSLMAVFAIFTIAAVINGSVYAQQSQSTKFQINEATFGMGGQDTCVGVNPAERQYCSLVTAGELTVGNTKSAQYQAYGGFNTERSPFLEAAILKSQVDLGVIKPDTTGNGTAEFQVKAYLAHGYVVQIYGTPPRNGTRIIAGMTTNGASTPGTEQFGMNLAVNTGITGSALPAQEPDSSFAYGAASDGLNGRQVYNVSNQFRYQSGEVIAFSDSSTSYTKYTISYIMNVSGVTPGGTYTTEQSIVATAKF